MSISHPDTVEPSILPSGEAELLSVSHAVETTGTETCATTGPETGSVVPGAADAMPVAAVAELPIDNTDSLVKELPEEVLAFLVRSTPPRALWDWLCQPKRTALLHSSTRGFQRTAGALRQPMVRSRLIRHLYEHTEDFRTVLKLWGEATPPPHVVPEIRALTDEATLESQLPDLWHRHGAEAVLLTLMLDDRRAALEALDDIAEEAAAQESDEAATEDNSDPDGLNRRLAGRRTMLRRNVERRAEGATSNSPAPLSSEEIAAQWQQRAEQAEAALQAAQHALVAQRAQWSEAQTQWGVQAKTTKRELLQAQQRLATDEAHLTETKKTLDRTTRRWKSLQKEWDELTVDNKRLKRQMRRQQQLNEELRKQLATVTARVNSLTPIAVETPSSAAQPAPAPSEVKPAAPRPQVSPLDQLFIWQSDGRPFRVTPREVKKAIDRNDEEFVFTLIQAFDALRETNEPGYRMFLDRIREFERYYSRVLTVDTTRVLIDASNVARYENNRYGKGQLRHLLTMRDELRRRDCFPIQIYADASLPYHIDEPGELMQMVKNGEIQMTNPGQEADELLAREARRTGAYVVTNDRSFHTKVSPDFEPPRVTFRIHDGFLIVDDF